MDINRLLGMRIKQIRKQNEMSQEKLAEEADMNVANIRQIEAMKGNPTMESLAKIARAFGIRRRTCWILTANTAAWRSMETRSR